jgi:hypothetical protein
MATSLKKAKVDKKSFWNLIYLSNSKNSYIKTNKEDDFSIAASDILKSHNINFINLKNKILLNLGCGQRSQIIGIKIF